VHAVDDQPGPQRARLAESGVEGKEDEQRAERNRRGRAQRRKAAEQILPGVGAAPVKARRRAGRGQFK